MSDEEFQKIKEKYNGELADVYEKVLIKRKSDIFIILGIFSFMGIFFSVFFSHFFLIPIFGIVGVIMFILAFKNRKYGTDELSFIEKYVSDVIKEVASYVFSDVSFTLKDIYDSEKIYEMSGFESSYDVFTHDFTGNFKYDNRDIKVFNICTEIREEDEDGNTEYTTSFYGLFGVMEMNQVLDGEIDVNRYYGENPNSFPKVNMDSVDFNKIYSVYASDKVLAMQLLTHDVMDDILKIGKCVKNEFEFKIVKNKIYFRIDDYNVFFNNSKEAINKKELDEVYEAFVLLKKTIDLVEKAMKDNGLGE